jgi:ribosomal protein S18 acetylase RimI-like enzyme
LEKEVAIRKVQKSDLLYIVNIERVSFGKDAFSLRQFKYLLQSSNCYFFSATLNGIPVGYLILLKRKGSKALRIYSIAIDSNHRGKGIAYRLIELAKKTAVEADFKRLTLEVSEINHAAIDLYRKVGFIPIGTKPNYYHDGSSALLMAKGL